MTGIWTRVLLIALVVLAGSLAYGLNSTQIELETTKEELLTIRNERNSLIRERNVLQRELESTQSELDAANTQLEDTKAELQDTRAQVRATRIELEAVRQEKIRLNQQYELTTAPASFTEGGGLTLPNGLLLFLHSKKFENESWDEPRYRASDSLDMIEGVWAVSFTTIEDDKTEDGEQDSIISYERTASPRNCMRDIYSTEVDTFRLTCDATVTWTIMHEDPLHSLTILTQADYNKVRDWKQGKFEEEDREVADESG